MLEEASTFLALFVLWHAAVDIKHRRCLFVTGFISTSSSLLIDSITDALGTVVGEVTTPAATVGMTVFALIAWFLVDASLNISVSFLGA